MQRKGGLGRGLDALFNDNSSDEQLAVNLRISEIEPNRLQPRKNFDEKALEELSESILLYGMLQPLLVRPKPNGGYEIVAGERRFRAARMALLETVPAIVRNINDTEILEYALVENLQREDLNPIEEAEGYKMLAESYGLTQDEISVRVGKSRSAIANSVRLLSLQEDILRMVRSGGISAGHGRAILAIDAPKNREKAADIAFIGASVREIESMAKKFKAGQVKEKVQPITPYYKEVELILTEVLGRKVRIITHKNKGTMEIDFYGKEDLAGLANMLGKEV